MIYDSTTESWKSIPGYEDYYDVSDYGRIRSLQASTKLGPLGGLIKLRMQSSGHLCVDLHKNGEVTTFRVHRLVMLAFVGPCPEGQEVRHLNGIPYDNRLSNLRYGSTSENRMDSVEHGTHNNASKTECAQGHEYTPENTYYSVTSQGGPRRSCKTCHQDSVKRSDQKRAEKGETCSIDECDSLRIARGYCRKHYMQWNRGKLS